MTAQKWSEQPTKATPVAADKSLLIDISDGQSKQFTLGSLGSAMGVVVLSPSANQTITAHDLTLANGGFFSGTPAGVAGSLTLYPNVASMGALGFKATPNTGNTNTIITNAAMGQDSTITIPDPGSPTATFLLSTSAPISPLTTKGDLYGFSTVNARIPVGTNAQVLTADSTQALGVKWATPTADLWTASGNLLKPTAAGTINEIQLRALTASTGNLNFISADNLGNFNVSITNAGYGQTSTLTIPDVGSGSGRFVMSNSTGNQNIAAALGINLTASSAVNITGSNILFHGPITSFSQVAIDDAALLITSSGNPFFKLQFDDTNLGMIADSMDGLGGSSPLWINQTGGFASFGLNPGQTISAQLQAASDQDPQFAISGKSTTAQLALFGYNIADDVFYIQGLNPSTTFSEVKLNPAGGNVSIGLSDGSIAQSLLDVEGDLYLASISTPSTPTGGNKVYTKSDGNLYSLDPSGIELNLTGLNIVTTSASNYIATGNEDIIYTDTSSNTVSVIITTTLFYKSVRIMNIGVLGSTVTPSTGTFINSSAFAKSLTNPFDFMVLQPSNSSVNMYVFGSKPVI